MSKHRVVSVLVLLAACSPVQPIVSPGDGGPDLDAGPVLSCEGLDLQSDPNNCGSCGHACAYRKGSFATCSQGNCQYVCQPGFADCDGNLTSAQGNGCEVELSTSASNCGACGNVCSSNVPGGTAACAAGRCVAACADGFGDCNLDLNQPSGNGCETDLRASATHCGECLRPCASTCAGGLCAGELPTCRLFPSEAPQPGPLSTATNGSTVALAWIDQANQGLWVAAVGPRGETLRAPRRLATLQSYDRLAIAHDGSYFAVAWTDTSSPGTMWLQRLSNAQLDDVGEKAQVQLGTSAPGMIVAASSAGRALFLAWTTGSSVTTVGWRADSSAPDSPKVVPLPGQLASGVSALAHVQGGWVIGWTVSVPAQTQGLPARLKLAVMTLTADGAAGAAVIDSPSPGADALQAGAVMASVGSGALLAAVEGIGPGQLRTLAFNDAGVPAPGPGHFQWQSLTAPYSFEGTAAIAGGASGAWILARPFTATGPELRFLQLASDGQAQGSPFRIGATVGSPDLHVVSTAQGALGVWRRTLLSTSALSRLETAFIDGTGRVGTACQP